MKIYTKGGDAGETSLFDQTRVSKADPRVEAYGEIDELNALLGVVLAMLTDLELREPLIDIQRDLFAVGAMLADPAARIAPRVTKAAIGAAQIERLEQTIDRLEADLPPLRKFILPGGGVPYGALLHLARTVCRRAERRIVGLGAGAFDPNVVVYVNRLSDLLFVMARSANNRAGGQEIEW